ncbi:hypothetical protein J6590_065451 [Homalodisca vitripennis]|nr:hypothetical protein J6590_065451 [Homalodisca vitripennis]
MPPPTRIRSSFDLNRHSRRLLPAIIATIAMEGLSRGRGHVTNFVLVELPPFDSREGVTNCSNKVVETRQEQVSKVTICWLMRQRGERLQAGHYQAKGARRDLGLPHVRCSCSGNELFGPPG